jgi:hypothetical protein
MYVCYTDAVSIKSQVNHLMAYERAEDDSLTEAPRLYPTSSIYMATTGS